MKVKNPELYEKVKKIVNQQYSKPSAYRSGAYIKLYKKMGGEFEDEPDDKTIDGKPLKRWMMEGWRDINPLKTESSYPVFRPTKRISKKTPLTVQEVDPENLILQSIKKQKIKGEKNLPKFEGGKIDIKRIEKTFNEIISHLEEHLTEAMQGKSELDPMDLKHYKLLTKELKMLKGGFTPTLEFSKELRKYSNPEEAQKKAYEYLGPLADIYPSWKPEKKYVIYNPDKNKFIHFGQMGYQDFTKHRSSIRRNAYLTRTAKMKGKWKDDPYSANNLSREILW